VDSFVVLFTEARTDATANDSLQSVSVVGRREATPRAGGVHELRDDD